MDNTKQNVTINKEVYYLMTKMLVKRD